jgi:arylsulfatase A-like enzyme
MVPRAIILILVALADLGGRETGPPNILLICADDLGWRDVGYHGSDFHETPNVDRFARESMVFTLGYAGASPVY